MVGKLGSKSSSNSSQPPNPPHFSLPTIFPWQQLFHYIFQEQSGSWQLYHFLIQKSLKSWLLNPFLSENVKSWQHNSFFFYRSAPDLGNLTLSIFARSAPDLGNFSIMYGIVFGAFCQLAYLFFGTQLEDYASLKWSG
jgi:hypothetical protein